MIAPTTKGERRELELLTQGPQPAYKGHGNRARSGVQNRLVLDRGWARYLPNSVTAERVEITEAGRGAFGRKSGKEDEGVIVSPKMCFLRDTRRTWGNKVVWWGPESAGYTSDLNEAGEYTEEEARDIGRNCNTAAIPVEVVRACSSMHVCDERLRDAMKKLETE